MCKRVHKFYLNQDYKPTYLRMIQNQVTALFNHAERFYQPKENPCKKVDKMGVPMPRN